MDPNKDNVDRIVEALARSFDGMESFSAADLLSGVFTFTKRVAVNVVNLSPDEESKKNNVEAASRALRFTEGMVRLAGMSGKEQVH